ncbi:ArsA family ATPase [Antrihabitans sp. YC3-6]|uniref:ArsA family ATPase n=1 Tax=Antrihabitans stalagmiti TaxID=2799499 RepID=A0A934NUY2_9NOCA|nr:ArsA family ATPase [Antrihabitans stalagmiti]
MEFFVGKGGVGKTTLACATAISRARSGERVLLASIDQAQSLGDALGRSISHDPGTTAAIHSVMDGLEAIEIDTLALLEERYRETSKMLSVGSGHDHGAELTALDAGELTGLPGAQEILGLIEIVEFASDDQWDTVVVDCGPTADALRTLAAPDAFLGYLERIWPKHKRIAAAIGTDLRMAVVVATIEKIAVALGGVRDVIADQNRTSVRLITVAERLALAEAARTRSALALLGLRLDAVVVNKVLPSLDEPGATDEIGSDDVAPAVRWYRNRRGEQLDVVAAFEESMTDVRILTAQHTGPEPVGLSSLGALAYAVNAELADAPPARGGDAQTVTVWLESGSGVDSVYAMRMHLPVVEPKSLQLARAEDDLIVGADGIRRRMRLASVLRRCAVESAELDGTSLVVRFRPDQKVWPK